MLRASRSGVLLAMPLDEFPQVFAGVCNMFPQSCCRQFRILRFADIEYLAVSLAGAVQVTRDDKVQTSIAIAVDVEFLQKRHHNRTIGGGVERGMETPVPSTPRLYLRIVLKRLFVMPKNIFSTLKIFFLHVSNRAAQHITFQNGPRFEQLHDLIRRKR